MKFAGSNWDRITLLQAGFPVTAAFVHNDALLEQSLDRSNALNSPANRLIAQSYMGIVLSGRT